MDTLPLLVILAVSAALFAFLLRRRRQRIASRTEAAAVAGLAAINCAGAVGLAWWAATILYSDGIMFEEHTICGVSIALLIAITVGALALDRRGMIKTALALADRRRSADRRDLWFSLLSRSQPDRLAVRLSG